MNRDRVYYLDFLRMIACFAVVMIHVSCDFLVADLNSLNFWGGAIMDSLSRIGVPLFVMISGALLLDEDYDYSNKKNWQHIKRLIIFFCVWSFLYCLSFQYLYPKFIKHQSINLITVLDALIRGEYHLWFIYMIIGLYLILPLLRLWVKKDNIKLVRYYLLLAFVFTFLLPQMVTVGVCYFESLRGCQEILDNIGLKYVAGYSTYFVLGWYLRFYGINHKRLLYITGSINVLITIIGTYVLTKKTGNYNYMFSNMNVNVLFPSMAVFIFAQKDVPVEIAKGRFVHIISKYSLGIYGVHVAVLKIARKFVENYAVNAFIAIPILFIITITISFFASIFLSKIKLARWIVI